MREWKKIEGFGFKEIIFEEYNHIAKIPSIVSVIAMPSPH